MKGEVLTGATEKELDRRQFLKAAGAATVLGVAGVLGGGLLSSCAPAKTPAPKLQASPEYASLRMVGGSIGSTGTIVVTAFSALFNKYLPDIEWSASSGATSTNPIYITKGSAKLGMAIPSNYLDAYGFDKVTESRLRSLSLPVPLTQYFLAIPEDKPWKDISDVPKGASFCPGPPGSAQPAFSEAWLKAAGLDKKDFNWIPLGKSEMADAWRAGKLDVAQITVMGMVAFLMDMYTSPRKFKPMGLSPEQVAKAKSEQTFERLGFTAPTKSLLTELVPDIFKYDIVCPQTPYFLICRDDFPVEIAYRMAKAIDEHGAELTQIFPAMKYATPRWHMQWAKPPFDIHSGIAKYYREKGYLK